MKNKITAKSIRERYSKIISIGYCDAQNLLSFTSPDYYTCGVYGWNFDVYDFNNVAICTGYRGMPKGKNYDWKRLDFYEKKAEEICHMKDNTGHFLSYEEINAKLKELLRDFLGEVFGGKK